jgi:hypothetical protein
MTTVLADACVQTARKSNRILSQLWVDGCLAMYGFYDALSGFLSQPQAAWAPTAFGPMFTSGSNEQQLWDFNWESEGMV